MSKQIVYTISVGMLPTVGFDRGDFEPERTGEWRRDKARGSTLGIGGVIGRDGSLRKARIRGSVAWYEFSTTVKAIQEEVLGDLSPQVLSQSHAQWEAMASQGQQSLYDDFLRQMGISGMAPTGEMVDVGGWADKGEQPSEQPVKGAGKEGHKSDKEMKAAGELVGQSKSIDLYFSGKDGKIYRVDVTTMSMDSEPHHGLTSKADRKAAGVTSSQLLSDFNLLDEAQADFLGAEKRLHKYFSKTQEGWNEVIQRLKKHIFSAHGNASWSSKLFLKRLEAGKTTLNDPNVISKLQNELKKGDKQNFLHQLRGTKKQSIRRMRQDAGNALGRQGRKEAFNQAVTFALHMLGNIVNLFAKNSAIPGGYATEFRVGEGIPLTIEVKHRIVASGKQVFEFDKLRVHKDVLLHKEAALQHVYMRELINLEREAQNQILDSISDKQSKGYAALGMTHDVSGVEIGRATSTLQSGLAKDGHDVYQRATTVITPKKFNQDIENWINNTNVRGEWKEQIHRILEPHIQEFDNIEQLHQGRGAHTQWASPISGATKQGGTTTLNEWTMMKHGGHPDVAPLYNADPDANFVPSRWRRYDSNNRMHADGQYGEQLIPREMSHPSNRYMHGSPNYMGEIADQRMKAAMIGNPRAKAETIKGRSDMYDNLRKFQQNKDKGMRVMGFSQGKSMLDTARSGWVGSGAMQLAGDHDSRMAGFGAGRTGKYWGLEEYLSRETQSGYDDTVNASWWAAPYISLLYPSGQVSSAT